MNPSSSRRPPRPPGPPPSLPWISPPRKRPRPRPQTQIPPPFLPRISSRPPPPPPLNPSSSRPGSSEEEGIRWILESCDGIFRERKIDRGEPILESDRDKTILTDREYRDCRLKMKRYKQWRTLDGIFDSTPTETSNNQEQVIPIQIPIRGHDEILFDKCQSNEVDANDYPFFLKSLTEEFPNVPIDEHISSLNFYKKSYLEGLEERAGRNSPIVKIRMNDQKIENRPEEGEECDLNDSEQAELFVQSLMSTESGE